MVDEVKTDGAPAPADDLDLSSEIAAAVEKQRDPERADSSVQPSAAASKSKEGKQDEPVETDSDRPRDEKGRFAPKDEAGEAEPGSTKDSLASRTSTEAAEPKDDAEVPKVALDALRPPGSFSAASKAKWDKLPEEFECLKADIAQREIDIDKGLKRYEGLAKFAELCERNGTNLPTAVAQYHQLENTIIKDPVAGIMAICHRLNIDPRILTSAMQAQFGGMLGTQAPAQQPATQATGQEYLSRAGQQAPQLNQEALINEVMNRVSREQSERDVNSKISAFKANPANKYFENVRPEMVAVLQSGRTQEDGSQHTLESAYEHALWMNPETRAIMLEERTKPPTQVRSIAAATQAKAAAKAVGGSPRPGLKPGGATDPNLSVTDTIIAAINAQRGAV